MHKQVDINLPPVRAAYGLDLAGGFAAVVRARKTRSGIQNETLLEVHTDDLKSALTETAQRIHAEILFQKAILAAAMPVQDSMARWLEAPFPSMAKARKVLPSLLDIQLPFPLETCIHGFPYMDAPGSGRVRALAVAAQKESVDSRIAACAELNVDPQCLDHEGLALWTQSVSEKPPAQGLRLVAYLGTDRTVWVIGEGDRFLSAHASKIGTRELGVASPDAPHSARNEWRDRALRNLRAQSASHPDTAVSWYWTGPGADDKTLIGNLESLLHASESGIHYNTHKQPASFLARALAVRALEQREWPWNYRFADAVHPAVSRWRDRARRRTAWTVMAAGLALCLLNLSFGALSEIKNRQADHALERLAQSITGLPSIPRGQERVVVQRALEEQRGLLDPFLRAFDPSHTVTLHDVLRRGQSGGLRYESISLRADHLLIQGSADDWDGCEGLADQLRNEGWTVNLDRQDAVAVEHVRFRLTAGRSS